MGSFRKFPGLLILFILTGCSTETEEMYQPVESIDIAGGYLQANEVIPQQNLVISTEADWNELVDQIESVKATEGFSGPNIDFKSYSVLAVFDKTRPHTGYSIDVKQVLESDDHLLARVSTQNTQAGFTVLIQPFHLVKIKKTEKPVFFK